MITEQVEHVQQIQKLSFITSTFTIKTKQSDNTLTSQFLGSDSGALKYSINSLYFSFLFCDTKES